MKWFERVGTALDRFQSRRSWLAVPVAVWRKFYDDQAAYLAALVCYFGFVAIFPLLLIFVTILDVTLKNHPELHRDLLDSVFTQYPVLGDQISNNLGQVSGTGFQLGVGIAVLMLGTRGVAFAMQNALCHVWGISRAQRPHFAKRALYGLAQVTAIGIGLVVTSFLSGVAGGAGDFLTGFGAYIGALAVSLTLNAGVFWLSFRLATMRMVPWRDMWRGAVLAAVVWQVLQVAGAYFLTHSLHRASALYGTFGVVLGLLGWLYLQATVTLYCAEVDAVLTMRRWPRSLLSAAGTPPEGAIRPRGTVRDETVPEGQVPDGVREEPAPEIPAQAAPVQAELAREDRAEAAIGDGGHAGARQDDSRENGIASRDAGTSTSTSKDRARYGKPGKGSSAA
jgi:YihY family inner membrane protein